MLSVYSRHYPPCTSDDINYKRCRCPKWVNGILGSDGPFIRRSAKTRSWEKAEEFKRELESEYEVKQNGDRESVAVAPEKVSVKDAVSRFISSKRNENLAESTLSRHVGRRTSRKEEKARTINRLLLLLLTSGLDQDEPCCFIGSYPRGWTSDRLFPQE